MNKRIEKKLSKSINLKRKAFRNGVRIPLTRPERKLARVRKDIFVLGIAEALKDCHEATKSMGLSYKATKEVINFMSDATISNDSCEVIEIEFKDKR